MAILRTIPSTRVINGVLLETSEIAIISEKEYKTNGEECIVVKSVPESIITLNSITTDHIVVKSLTNVTIKPDVGRIDEDYDEVIADKYACIPSLTLLVSFLTLPWSKSIIFVQN